MTALFYFLGVLAFFLVTNWYMISVKKRSPNHTSQAIFRSIAWSAAFFWFPYWPDKIMYFISFHLAFMMPFNIFLNLMDGKAWNYIGNTAWIDRKGREWPAVYIQGQFLLFLIGMGTLVFGTYW